MEEQSGMQRSDATDYAQKREGELSGSLVTSRTNDEIPLLIMPDVITTFLFQRYPRGQSSSALPAGTA